MAVWSTASPPTAKLSLTTAWVQISARAYEKVASDSGLGGGFSGYSGFVHHLELASQDLYGRKNDEKRK